MLPIPEAYLIVYFLYINRRSYSRIAIPIDFDRKVEYLLPYNSSKTAFAPQTRRELRGMSPLKAEHERLLHLYCHDLSSAILFSQ